MDSRIVKVTSDYNLKVLYPNLVLEWHSDNQLGPECYLPKSSFKARWVCDKKHSWIATVANRTRGSGCPFCSGRVATPENNLAVCFPEIASEWHADNEKLPDNYTPVSSFKAKWICSKGHEWLTIIGDRTRKGSGCPSCCGQKATPDDNLLVTQPELASEWHPDNENGPECYKAKSHFKAKWKCQKGHEWVASINSRHRANCRYCSGRFAYTDYNLLVVNPQLASEWHPDNIGTPCDYTPKSNFKAKWRCRNGHEWIADIKGRAYGNGCPNCGWTISKSETDWLDALGLPNSTINRQVHIRIEGVRNGYLVDGFDPQTNTVYEFDGDYWHGNPEKHDPLAINEKTKRTFGSHFEDTLKKRSDLQRSGYTVVSIWESEWKRIKASFTIKYK
jgi:hypothetical protein